MKTPFALIVVILSYFFVNAALAQAYYPGSQIRQPIASSRGQLGTLVMPGQIFPFAIPIASGSSNPAIAALGVFHAGTLARNPYQAAAAVCAADAAEYISEATADLDNAAEDLRKYYAREALGVAQWGTNYVIVIARFSGSNQTVLWHYPMKQVAHGQFCLTKDLRSDGRLIEVVGFLFDGIKVPVGPGAPTN